jgi:hypothetical protein
MKYEKEHKLLKKYFPEPCPRGKYQNNHDWSYPYTCEGKLYSKCKSCKLEADFEELHKREDGS